MSTAIKKGDYWVKHNRVVAFVLEVNEYGVIFQKLVSDNEEKQVVVFDFEAGQELISIERFLDYIKKESAEIYGADQASIEASLQIYENMKHTGRLSKRKYLPRNSSEGEFLKDTENYKFNKQIVPPPKELRGKKMFHWLVGRNLDHVTTPKLWDPKADNWVMQNGQVDVLANLGFVSGYLGPALITSEEVKSEEIDEFIKRLTGFIKGKGFVVYEKKFVEELKRELGENTSIKPFDFAVNRAYLAEHGELYIEMFLDGEVHGNLFIAGVINENFIDGNSIELEMN